MWNWACAVPGSVVALGGPAPAPWWSPVLTPPPPLRPPGSAPLQRGSLGFGSALVRSFRRCLCCRIPEGGSELRWLPFPQAWESRCVGAGAEGGKPGQGRGEEAAGRPGEHW